MAMISCFLSCQLIVTKFQYPNGGDVNYVAFIQAIDEEYTGQAMEQESSRLGFFLRIGKISVQGNLWQGR